MALQSSLVGLFLAFVALFNFPAGHLLFGRWLNDAGWFSGTVPDIAVSSQVRVGADVVVLLLATAEIVHHWVVAAFLLLYEHYLFHEVYNIQTCCKSTPS